MAKRAAPVNDPLTDFLFLAILPNNLREDPMTLQILGGGCPRCAQLEKNAKEAIARLGLNATVAKVTDRDEIVEMGVLVTPALAVDGSVKRAGAVLSVDQIVQILKPGA
jgi:small redox-active disulfide protein 2